LTTSEKSKVLEYTATMMDTLPASDDYVSRKRNLSGDSSDHAQKKHCPESSVVAQSEQHQHQQPTNTKSSTATTVVSSVQSAVSYTVSVCVCVCVRARARMQYA